MRVLHVIDSIDPRTGGPPAVVLRLAAAQAIVGHETGILTYRTPASDERIATSMRGIPGVDRVAIHQLDRERNAVARMLGSATTRWMAAHAPNWEMLHIHGIWDPPVRACSSFAVRQGLPYAIVPHASLDEWAMRQTPVKRLKKMLAMSLQVRGLLNSATFIHSLNEAESAGIRRVGVTSPLEIIPNGVFVEEFSETPSRGEFRAKHPELGDLPFVLFLSRLHYKKGLDFLVAAFEQANRKLPELRLVIAGPDDGERTRVEADVAARGLADRVHLIGPIFGREKYAALVDALAFCLPSRMEGFSIAILEALAFRCPVIISPQCNFPEVAANEAGIEVALEPEGIAAAMVRLASSEDDRARLSASGQALVTRDYTWPSIARLAVARYRHYGVGT